MKLAYSLAAACSALSFFPASTIAADYPQWGLTNERNMVSHEKGLPTKFDPGKKIPGTEEIDLATTKNCLWVAKLGSAAYGTPMIADGRVYVGTNNESPRDSKHKGDRGVVMCFKEGTGEFLWQLVEPKLGTGKVNDWEFLGICDTPTIIGNRAYVVTNRCQVLCLDVEGMANGNQGLQDEGKMMTPTAAPGQPPPAPMTAGSTDADIIWKFDMREECGIFPHNAASSYILAVGDKLYVTTSNGVDWSHTNIPSPNAPSLICLNKDTGELVSEMDPIVSQRVLHCSWSSPTHTKVDGKDMIIFAGGDGWTYGLSSESETKEDINTLKEFWRYDSNPPEYRHDKAGKPIKYTLYEGPSEIISTPTIWKNKVYIPIGQDPEHGEGVGMLSCLDIKGSGDRSGKAKWTFKEIERSMSTPSISDEGLLFIADHTGRLFCLDAETGKKHSMYDTKGHIWASTLLAEGRVYIGNEEGELTILEANKDMKVLDTIEFPGALYGAPVAANGVLYITTQNHMYAFKEGAVPVVPAKTAEEVATEKAGAPGKTGKDAPVTRPGAKPPKTADAPAALPPATDKKPGK